MSDAGSESKPSNHSPDNSEGDLGDGQIRTAPGSHPLGGSSGSKWKLPADIKLNLAGSWRGKAQSRAEGLVTGSTDERSPDDQRTHPWTPGLHMDVRARGALVSRDREVHRSIGHDGYANQVYGNRHVKSGFEHSVYSKDRVVVVQGMEGLGNDILPDVRFGRDTLDVAEDAVLKFKARTTLMSGTLTRRYLGGFVKAAPMEGVICGGTLVRTIGGPSASLSGLATGDVYGGAARAALSPSFDARALPVACDLDAERCKHAFRMIARRHRLGHARASVRVQSRQQDARLDLRARHRARVAQRRERAAGLDGKWGSSAVRGLDSSPHLRQGPGDPAHRSATQRFVAHQRAVEPLTREHACQQAHRGSRIAQVDCALRLRQSVPPYPANDDLAAGGSIDLYPHRPKRGDGGKHVLAFEQSADAGISVGDGAEHDAAVRDGLVARYANLSTQHARRMDDM